MIRGEVVTVGFEKGVLTTRGAGVGAGRLMDRVDAAGLGLALRLGLVTRGACAEAGSGAGSGACAGARGLLDLADNALLREGLEGRLTGGV